MKSKISHTIHSGVKTCPNDLCFDTSYLLFINAKLMFFLCPLIDRKKVVNSLAEVTKLRLSLTITKVLTFNAKYVVAFKYSFRNPVLNDFYSCSPIL